MNFLVVAQVFEKIEKVSSRNEITKLLANLFNHASPEEARIISYLSLGALFPPYKSLKFNIAKKGIVSVIAKLLNETDACTVKLFNEYGDFGSLVQAKFESDNVGDSVEKIYELLITSAKISGIGSTEKKSDSILKLLQSVDSLSAKFIIRIINGTLRLGFSDMTIIDALSWMYAGDKSIRKNLENAYNVCADLGLVAFNLKQQGINGIDGMSVQVGIPIRPAAAERLNSYDAIIDRLGNCVAQPKLDGFRVQIHLRKDAGGTFIHFYSRNLLDMSEMFPEIKKIVENLNVQSLICEGEAIVFDEDTETFLPFQQTVKRKRKHDIDQASEDLPLRLYIFDLLYLNGQSLLDVTHKERRKKLIGMIDADGSASIQVIEQKDIKNSSELESYFLKNINAGLEGLVVKREDAIYQPGKRNFNWIKLKRNARGKLVDTVDAVILGYYFGKGKRTSFGIGAFLVGVYNEEKDLFQSVAKVGTGLKDDEWRDLKERCEKFEQRDKSKNVDVAKDLIPDVWVKPEIVCIIQSDEISRSPIHTAGKTDESLGFALRFPRFISYRFDKSAEDATTVSEIKSLYKQQFVEG